jgi:hypothetical protein
MADELRKTLDIQAFSLASRQAHRNSAANPTVFNMQGAVGEAETNRIQVITRYIDKCGTKIYNRLFRGGVSVIFGGPLATGVLTGHNRWNDTGAQDANGIYKLGNLGDIPDFRVPTEVCADGEKPLAGASDIVGSVELFLIGRCHVTFCITIIGEG